MVRETRENEDKMTCLPLTTKEGPSVCTKGEIALLLTVRVGDDAATSKALRDSSTREARYMAGARKVEGGDKRPTGVATASGRRYIT